VKKDVWMEPVELPVLTLLNSLINAEVGKSLVPTQGQVSNAHHLWINVLLLIPVLEVLSNVSTRSVLLQKSCVQLSPRIQTPNSLAPVVLGLHLLLHAEPV